MVRVWVCRFLFVVAVAVPGLVEGTTLGARRPDDSQLTQNARLLRIRLAFDRIAFRLSVFTFHSPALALTRSGSTNG